MMLTKRALRVLIGVLFFLGGAQAVVCLPAQSNSQAEGEGTYETEGATVTRFGDTGYYDVFSAYTILKHKVAVAGFRDNVDRDALDLDISNFIGAITIGLSDRVELFARIDAQRRIDRDADVTIQTVPAPFYSEEPRVFQGWSSGLGDVSVGAKVNVLSEYDGKGVGLAVRGFLKLPTADDGEGLGTGGTGGGAHLVLSKNLGDAAESSYYVGFRGTSVDDAVQFDVGNAFDWGLGFSFPRKSVVRGMAEVTGSVFNGADIDQTSPVDLLLGLNLQMDNGFFITAGWRTNFNFDVSGETASGLNVRIGFHPGVRGEFIPPPEIPPPANRPPTVTVTATPPEIEEGADSTVTADAQDPDGDPLTYAWRAPDGRITGSGPRVTWTAPTGVEGSYPVTVTVDDGRGGTASDTTNIRVRRKVVQAIEFDDVHFLFDRYDLTDEARSILDRAAAVLRDNSQLRIEIEGHCCSIGTEEYNMPLGARRADAVKDYLVRAGIPESRLSTISYGEARPAHDNSREVTRRLNRRAHLRVLVTAPNE